VLTKFGSCGQVATITTDMKLYSRTLLVKDPSYPVKISLAIK